MHNSNELSGLTILIVEDEPLVAMSLAEDIEAAGGVVLGPAGTLAAAFGLLGGAAPQIAILDVELGGELVFPLADALAERGIRFLFTTGYDAGSLPDGYGGVPVLEKPLAPAALFLALAQLR